MDITREITREEAIANLNMISVAFVEPVTEEQRKLIDDTFEMAIKALEQESCDDMVSRGVFEQVMWERDVAISQLKKLGCEFRQKVEPCEDAISREPFIDSTICEGLSCNECSFNRKDKGGCILEERVKALPSIQQEPKTGHWIEIAQYSDGNHKIECSECKSHIFDRGHANSFNVKNKYKYCPNCGARMIESEDEK